MASGDSDRLREQISVLIDALSAFVEAQQDPVFVEMAIALRDRLNDALFQAEDPHVFSQSWPELQSNLSGFAQALERGSTDINFVDITASTAIAPAALMNTIDRLLVEGSDLVSRTADTQSAQVSASPDAESGADVEVPPKFVTQWEQEAAEQAESAKGSGIIPPIDRKFGAPAVPPASPFSEKQEWDPRAASASHGSGGGGGGGGAPPVMRSMPAEPPNEQTTPSKRVVNTGFSDRGQPEGEMSPDHPLKPDTDYWYWVEIGELLQASIEDTPTALPSFLPADAVLSIAIFSFPNELILSDTADQGTVRLTGPIASVVVTQPGNFDSLFSDKSLRQRRMFFPVKTPATPGRYRMRCNIYYQHILLQSRIIAAYVDKASWDERALRSTVDYKISSSLDPTRLANLVPQTLSVFINENSPDTHGFYFEGDQLKTQSIPDGQQLQDALDQTRKSLRRVAWGSADPYQPSFSYRYASNGEPPFFANDLIALAIRGFIVWDTLIDTLSGDIDATAKFTDLLRQPGHIQIGSKQSARMVVPAAIFYDYPLDTQPQPPNKHSLCDAFLQAVRSQQDLASTPCFRGQCPHLDDRYVVCPGGFWGFRHQVSLPVSISEATIGDAETVIQFNDPAAMVVIVSMDQMFKLRETHEGRLKLLRTPLGLTLCESRQAAITALQQQNAQLVYFYCHGGVTGDNTPFLSIGNNEAFTPDNLRGNGIRWKTTRPLVFMNGCMTAALEPEKAIDFVSAFVNRAGASGVIGTEITVFEPLATAFAQAFLQRFIGECKSLGESVKLARLALLQQFNPLGLVYIPFALNGLRLVDLTTAPPAAAIVQPPVTA